MVDHAGSLSDLNSQADRLNLSEAKLQRLWVILLRCAHTCASECLHCSLSSRKNPYSGRTYPSNEKRVSKLHKIPFPTQVDEESLDSLEALNNKLEDATSQYSSLKVIQECEKWDKRSIIIQLSDIAVFHIFLRWKSESLPRFQRLNVLGLREEVSSCAKQDGRGIRLTVTTCRRKAIERRVGLCGRMPVYTPRKPFKGMGPKKSSICRVSWYAAVVSDEEDNIAYILSELQSVIDAYRSVQEQPCRYCHKLLHDLTLQLPTARVYQSFDPEARQGEWTAYHAECYVNR